VSHFTAAESQGGLDLHVFAKEADRVLPLNSQVMGIDTRRELNLFHQVDGLMLLAVALLLRQFVFKLSVVNDTAHWRDSCRGDLDQIDSTLSGQVNGGGQIHDPDLLSINANDTNLAGSNLSVDSVLRLTRLRA
jgi:hypothetical protein